MGAILARVEAWWIDQDFQPDHGACLAFAKTLAESEDANSTTARRTFR